MIKGHYFSKFLKLFLFGFGISCFTVLGNFVNGVENYGFIQIGGDYIENNADTHYFNAVLKRGKLLTQYIGYTKPLFAMGETKLFFWNGNKPYLFDRYGLVNNCGTYTHQGYITKMTSCPVIGGSDDFDITQCGDPVDYNEDIVSNFFSKVVAGDWFYYYRRTYNDQYCRSYYYSYVVCYSSHELNQSLCFPVLHDGTWIGLGENLQFGDNTSFSTINLSVLGDPPGWGTSTPEFTSSTGVGCVSVSEILNGFDNKYTTGYCYAPVIESGVVTNYFIEDIFSSYSEFQNLYSNFGAYCHAPLTDEYCNSMLNNNLIGKSLISKIYNSNYDFNLKDLWNYCHYTTLPLNATTCTLQSGGVAEPLTHDELLEAINSQPSSLVTPGENTIVSNVLGTGATDLSDMNIIDKLYGLYSRFTSFFVQQTGNNTGALPTYIISFLLVIILFKLFKK